MDRRSLYDDDVYAWSQQQAEALRRLAQTRRDLPNELDLENVAEEIEDLGISERNACASYIRQILVHLIKLACAPSSTAADHWRGEIVTFHNDLLQHLTPAMHARIDLPILWDRALKEASTKLPGEASEDLAFCRVRGLPLRMEDLANENFDADTALSAMKKES